MQGGGSQGRPDPGGQNKAELRSTAAVAGVFRTQAQHQQPRSTPSPAGKRRGGGRCRGERARSVRACGLYRRQRTRTHRSPSLAEKACTVAQRVPAGCILARGFDDGAQRANATGNPPSARPARLATCEAVSASPIVLGRRACWGPASAPSAACPPAGGSRGPAASGGAGGRLQALQQALGRSHDWQRIPERTNFTPLKLRQGHGSLLAGRVRVRGTPRSSSHLVRPMSRLCRPTQQQHAAPCALRPALSGGVRCRGRPAAERKRREREGGSCAPPSRPSIACEHRELIARLPVVGATTRSQARLAVDCPLDPLRKSHARPTSPAPRRREFGGCLSGNVHGRAIGGACFDNLQ